MTTNEQLPIPANSILVISSGAYSDYSVLHVCRTLCHVDMDKQRNDWLELYPEQKKAYKFNEYAFIAALEARGLIKRETYFEVHFDDFLGSEITIEVMRDGERL